MDDYEDEDGLGLAERVRVGDVTPTELLEAALSRVTQRDPALGAIVLSMEAVARRAIEEGLPDGPFQGVPYLLKDLDVSWPGTRLTQGSRLFADDVPEVESDIVRCYREAGLVVFGKTHSPEFGITTSSESVLHGQTHNPWNPEYSAGGSSGGAAAAVAAGIAPLANASDGGGSIRIPASCCGLFGLKPSRGRTPLGPEAGEGWSGMVTVHAVTRSVRDSAALLDATSAHDPLAPYSAQPPERPYLEEVGTAPGRLRIAIQRIAWNEIEPHPDCEAALDDAAALCRDLGHEVVEAPFDAEPSILWPAMLTIISANTRAILDRRAAAIGRSVTGDDVEPGTWALAAFADGRNAVDYVEALRILHATGRSLEIFLNDFDVILSPTMAVPPPPLGVLSLSNPDVEAQAHAIAATTGYTQLLNATGHPAMSVPLFWGDAGLPIGVQFAGRRDDEATLFRLAAQLEQARPWFSRRPPVARS